TDVLPAFAFQPGRRKFQIVPRAGRRSLAPASAPESANAKPSAAPAPAAEPAPEAFVAAPAAAAAPASAPPDSRSAAPESIALPESRSFQKREDPLPKVIVSAAPSTTGSPAGAPASGSERPPREQIEDGQAALDAGDHEAALAAFRRALGLLG